MRCTIEPLKRETVSLCVRELVEGDWFVLAGVHADGSVYVRTDEIAAALPGNRGKITFEALRLPDGIITNIPEEWRVVPIRVSLKYRTGHS